MIKIICVAYERPIELRGLIDSFLLQTDDRWALDIIHDGEASDAVWDTIHLYNDSRIRFFESETRNGNYGHPNREGMLKKLDDSSNDYVLITNDDNYYVPVFVEYMLGECADHVGFVYCDSVHSHFKYTHHNTQIREHWIDIGSFIVRIDIAKGVGFVGNSFSADGVYAEHCYESCCVQKLDTSYIPKPLFIHN